MADDLRVFFPVYELPEFFNNERACPCCFGLQKGDVRYILLYFAIFCSFTAKLGVEKGVILACFFAQTQTILHLFVYFCLLKLLVMSCMTFSYHSSQTLGAVLVSKDCLSDSLYRYMCKKHLHMQVYVSSDLFGVYCGLFSDLCQITGVSLSLNFSVSTFAAKCFHISPLGLQ